MKALLGSLLCLVLFASECFAIKGGPVYPGGGTAISTTGTFAAVLMPDPLQSPGANSIALFSIDLPSTGLGNGTVVIFQTGETYTGTIEGLTDPDSGVFNGLIDASFPYVRIVETGNPPAPTEETVIAVASGRVTAKVVADQNQFSTTEARLVGTADVQFSLTVNNVDSEIIYDVFGFKQSDT